MILQLGNHYNIALDKAILLLLHPLGVLIQYTKASISARNKLGAYIKIFIDVLIRHNAQKPPMDVVMVVFLCSRQCYNGYLTVVSKMACFKTIVNFCLI